MHNPVVSKALEKRREGQPKWVIQQADRARKRLYRKYWRMVRKGKSTRKIVVALARELAGFIWSVLYPIAKGVPEACVQCGQIHAKNTSTDSKFLERICPQCSQA